MALRASSHLAFRRGSEVGRLEPWSALRTLKLAVLRRMYRTLLSNV